MPHFSQGVCPISGTGLNWPSPSFDDFRHSYVLAAHELPACGPPGLPMSCTPPTQELGEMTHPWGSKLPPTCTNKRRKCVRLEG